MKVYYYYSLMMVMIFIRNSQSTVEVNLRLKIREGECISECYLEQKRNLENRELVRSEAYSLLPEHHFLLKSQDQDVDQRYDVVHYVMEALNQERYEAFRCILHKMYLCVPVPDWVLHSNYMTLFCFFFLFFFSWFFFAMFFVVVVVLAIEEKKKS